MRFPYAYYQNYYDGPIHGESFRGQMLILDPETAVGGDIDVNTFSHLQLDSTTGDLNISGFHNGYDGQLLFIVNKGTANKVVLTHNGSGTDKILSPTGQNVWVEASGCAILMRVQIAGATRWLVLEATNNEIGLGSAALPSLYIGGDRNTGIYSAGADSVGFSTSGVGKLMAYTSYVTSLVSHRFFDGSVGNPSIGFNSDPDTGFYKLVDGIGITMDGVQTGFFDKTGIFGSLGLQSTNGFLLSDNFIQLYQTDVSTPTGMLTGYLGVGATDYVANASQIPVNGIYAEGNIKSAGFFEGVATSAQFADLAERYHAEPGLTSGDVVSLSGGREIEKSSNLSQFDILGVISTDPAFKMNDKMKDNEDYPFVAMTGRVPCKVKGKVNKGQRLVISDEPGVAQGYSGDLKDLSPFQVIGRSLESSQKEEERLIEIVVGRL